MIVLLAFGAATVGRAQEPGQACDRVARPTANPARFVGSLGPGMTGCLPGRTFRTKGTIRFSRSGVSLRSLPGERATVIGRIWVEREADRVTVRGINLDGRNSDRLPSPTVNGDHASFLGNQVTNHHTGICFVIGDDQYGEAKGTLIEDNRIHDCGKLPATNHEHGIYVAHATNTVIRDNRIYSNADRGIQLYPDADRSLITGNVIKGNGQGLIFSGDEDSASQRNLVVGNVIKNSKLRYNVEGFWPGPVGSRNQLRGNCIYGGIKDRQEGGGGIERPPVGFQSRDNLTRASGCSL